jgi:hypothetical protein
MTDKRNILYQIHKKVKEAISARKKIILWQLTGRAIPPPHAVKQRIVKYYAAKFRPQNFIETGTYMGEMIAAVLNTNTFDKIISIEFDQALAERAKNKFASYSHVTILQGDSGQVLPSVISGITEPCLFWLDAHYAGGVTSRGDLETPIIKELKVILEHSCPDHVILIDDAREFTGENDYPTLKDVEKLVLGKRGDWLMEVDADVIRLHKAVKQKQ